MTFDAIPVERERWVNVGNGDAKVGLEAAGLGLHRRSHRQTRHGEQLVLLRGHSTRPRTTSGAINRFRVPVLERQGDFSKHRHNGALFNTIAMHPPACRAHDRYTRLLQDGGAQTGFRRIGCTDWADVLKRWPVPTSTA
jgi:hypothetical protein